MRSPRTVMVLGLLLAACGSANDATGDSSPDENAGAGLPDRMVVALDEFAAVHALTIGVEPDVVFTVFGYESTTPILGDRDIHTVEYGSELDLEAVAAAAPDVIFGVSLPTTASARAELEQIAPTTIIDYTAGWDEQLASVAEALGAEDAAREVRDRIAERTQALAEDLAAEGLDGTVTSVIGDNGGFFSPPSSTAVGSILAEVGLDRPAAQHEATESTSPFALFAPETFTDHDGEQLFLLSGGPYQTEGLRSSPLWSQLRAVQDDAVSEVSGEMWLGPSAFSVAWVLDDVRAVLLNGAPPADVGEASQRLADFVED